MAVKHIISPGIGFSPGSVEYIVTRGFGASQAVAETGTPSPDVFTAARRGQTFTANRGQTFTATRRGQTFEGRTF